MAINVAQAGFGAAVLAGLILAFIGHPQPTIAPAPQAASVAAGSPNAPPGTFVLKSVSVDLPASDRTFPGPNNQAISDNCLACHSAGMVLTQPDFPRATWAAEVDKMIHAFKAPVSPTDAAAIVDYLQATKGAK